MERLFKTTALAVLTLMWATGNSSAQGYSGAPYLYKPGNAGIMGIGPGGREAYQPQYYSSAPYFGYGMFGGYGWGMNSGYGYGPANSSPNVTGMPSAPEAAPDESYLQRRRPGATAAVAAAAPTNPNAAAIDVAVPAGSQLMVQGQQTQQKGRVRFFESPPLQPGKTYAYKLQALWTNANGEKVERTRTVQVHAGDYVRLDLRRD